MLDKAEGFVNAGDYVRAEASLTLAIRTDPDKPEAYLYMAQLKILQEEYESALESVDVALEKDPLYGDAWATRCIIDQALGDEEAYAADALYAEICDTTLTTLRT
jgi:Tfp pilus assembly protein PilF